MNFLLIMKSGSFLREAICSFIKAEIDGANVFRIESLDEIRKMSSEQIAETDLVLLYADQEHTNGNTSIEGVRILNSSLAGVPIVLMGSSNNMRSLSDAMRMGIKGYIPASTPAEIVKHALPLVAVGGVFLPTEDLLDPSAEGADASHGSDNGHDKEPESVALRCVDSVIEHHDKGQDFTMREVDVLRLLGLGLQNKIIAHRLGLKESTVKVHVRHIMRKLKATSRTQAALYAQREFPAESSQS